MAPYVYSTPPHILKAILEAIGWQQFCLDTASPRPPTVPCRHFFTEDDDGLMQPWHGSLVFCNPPYEELGKWIAKAVHEYTIRRAHKVVLLVPSCLGAGGMRHLFGVGAAIFMLDKRLKYGKDELVSRYETLVCVLGGSEAELARLETMLPSNQRYIVRKSREKARLENHGTR